MKSIRRAVLAQICAIERESNIDSRVAMLKALNYSLPLKTRLKLPSMFTNASVRNALEIIEKTIPSI